MKDDNKKNLEGLVSYLALVFPGSPRLVRVINLSRKGHSSAFTQERMFDAIAWTWLMEAGGEGAECNRYHFKTVAQ